MSFIGSKAKGGKAGGSGAPMWRLQPPSPKRRGSVATGCANFDALVGGGLPRGLTTFYGVPGSGKTTLALHLAGHLGERALYIVTERIEERVLAMWREGKTRFANYAAYRPKWDRFSEEIVKLADSVGAEVIFVDSITAVFGWESEIRGPVMQFAGRVSDAGFAVVGVSQARGSGSVAGGLGVLHASTLVLRFEKLLIDASWLSKRYGRPEGSYVWLVDVEKDANGVAPQGTQYVFTWNPRPLDGEPVFTRVAEV